MLAPRPGIWIGLPFIENALGFLIAFRFHFIQRDVLGSALDFEVWAFELEYPPTDEARAVGGVFDGVQQSGAQFTTQH